MLRRVSSLTARKVQTSSLLVGQGRAVWQGTILPSTSFPSRSTTSSAADAEDSDDEPRGGGALIRWGLVGLTLAGIGGYYSYQSRLKANKSVNAKEFNVAQVPPAASLISKFSTVEEMKKEGKDFITLYRYTSCPYCGTVQSFLDYHGIPYQTVEVEPMFKSQISSHGYRKVPQIRVGGEQGPLLVDSREIIMCIADTFKLNPERELESIKQWRHWAREVFIRILVVNLNASIGEAFQGFAYIDSVKEIPASHKLFLKISGGPIMFLVAKYATIPRLAEQGYDVKNGKHRAVLVTEINKWVSSFPSGKPFHGGDKPDIADLDCYGVFRVIKGHSLYDELLSVDEKFGAWVGQMDKLTRRT